MLKSRQFVDAPREQSDVEMEQTQEVLDAALVLEELALRHVRGQLSWGTNRASRAEPFVSPLSPASVSQQRQKRQPVHCTNWRVATGSTCQPGKLPGVQKLPK